MLDITLAWDVLVDQEYRNFVRHHVEDKLTTVIPRSALELEELGGRTNNNNMFI